LNSKQKAKLQLKKLEEKRNSLKLQLAGQEKIVDENKNKLFGEGAKRRKEAEKRISQIQADRKL